MSDTASARGVTTRDCRPATPGPRECAHCGSPTVPIRYGDATSQTMERALRGEVALGGGPASENRASRQCVKCGRRQGWLGGEQG